MTIHPELERQTPLSEVPGRLRIILVDEHATGRAADVVTDVVGLHPSITGAVTLSIDGVDGRTAVDLLAELAWASVVPIAFSLD
ncbi:MAG: hypothetical protein L0K86_24370 [Actinomycetia bacterium]|nr:hypothetical protein [Actinomycetes bacterium]